MRDTASSDCYGDVRALARRDFWRRWRLRLGCLVALISLSVGGYRGYGALREKNLVRQTREFVAKGDYQSAVLVARRVLQLNQNNVAACRVMAETAESAGRGEALSWRQRVSALEPNVPENQLALAETALRFGQIDVARNSLESVSQAARASVKYHELSGGLAIAEKQPAAAESQFAAALQLEPGNARLALNLAVIRLASSNLETIEKGRADLVRLAGDPSTRLESLRALASNALAHKSHADAQRWAAQLNSEKSAIFADALLYLEAVQTSDAAPAALLEVEAKAKNSPAAVVALLTWMNRHEMAKSAIEWGLSLPKDILMAQPVPLAVAESYSFLQDWRALQEWVEGKNWAEYECFRLAVLSHALHHLGPSDRSSMESQTVWRAALAATKSRPERLAPIAQLAEGWGYTDQAEDAWWIIANGKENATAALTALQRLYQSKQDSHGLLRVAKRALELNPGDLVAANNCASLGLLLTGDGSARRLATKLHFDYPASTVFSATYAFALHLEGKTGPALKVMETLKEAELHYPAIAAYYFVMLVENGNMERAQSFLPAANQAALLPEEQKLLTDATRKLLANDAKPVAVADSAKS
jgi:lipopolysaccharide biosynthesis regulator YciM